MIPGFFAAGATAGEALWTPENLSNPPKIWLDWMSSVTDVSGFASSWSNRGSVGGSFTQSDAGLRPEILASEVGGKRALRFDNDYIESLSVGMGAIAANVASAWLFSAYKKRGAGTGNNTLFSTSTNGGSGRFNSTVGSASTTRPTMNVRRLDSDSSAQLSSSLGGTGVWLLRFDRMDYSTGAADIFVDGVLAASNPALTSAGNTSNTIASPERPRIAAFSGVVASNMADVDVALLMFGSGSLPSSGERERLEGWSAWQLGLQGNLPVGHPYKDAPPYA